jgi:hypothetical protein
VAGQLFLASLVPPGGGFVPATAIKNCRNSKRKNYDEIESPRNEDRSYIQTYEKKEMMLLKRRTKTHKDTTFLSRR